MSDSASTLAQFVVAGARLRRELAPFEEDQALMERGGKVFYAIDTNIVWQFLNPRAYGPRRGPVGGYTEVFPEDQTAISEALAAALSRYILYRLNRFLVNAATVDLPLLLLDGHDAEVGSIYDRLMAGFYRDEARNRAELAHLRSLLDDVVHAGGVEAQMEEMRSSAQRIVEALYLDDSLPAQASRLSRLITDARLARLHAAADAIARIIPTMHQETVREAASGPRDLISDVFARQLRRDWQVRLRSTKVNFERPMNLLVDARALAQLESINTDLASSELRVCLITGDVGMISAARGYVTADGRTFADRYLRHPRAFLAAHEVLVPARKDDKTRNSDLGLISNWLDTLLARFSDDQAPSPEKLEQLIEKPLDEHLISRSQQMLKIDPSAVSKLRKEWAAHTEAVLTEHAAPSSLAQEEIARALGADNVIDLRRALDQIEAELGTVSDATWDSYYRAVVRAGYDLILAGKPDVGARRARNAPAIKFDSFEAASTFAKDIIAARGQRKFRAGEIDGRLNHIEQQGGGYAVLIAYAMLFADAGRWHVALLTAKRAITVAKLYRSSAAFKTGAEAVADEVRKKISGREAYYFAAVAQRMTARNVDELKPAGHYLAAARSAFAEDEVRKGRADHVDLRFESEALAQDVTRYMFTHFGLNDAMKDARQNDSVASDFHISLIRASLDLAGKARQLEDRWTQRAVERSALVNFFSVISLAPPTVAEVVEQDASVAAHRLLDLMKADDQPPAHELPVTELVAMVGMYAESRFTAVPRRRKNAIYADIIKFKQDDDLMSRSYVMPYDQSRFSALIALIERALVER